MTVYEYLMSPDSHPDRSGEDPAIRRIRRELGRKMIRRARRQRIAAKQAGLLG